MIMSSSVRGVSTPLDLELGVERPKQSRVVKQERGLLRLALAMARKDVGYSKLIL